jgi:hypothetical protein
MQVKLMNKLPEELICLIYRHFYSRVVLNGSEFKTKLFKTQLKGLSFKQRRNMLAYYNHPTI